MVWRAATKSLTSWDAFASEPESKGGCGSYSISSWYASAATRPAASSASRSAMSIPEETPAEVMIRPCSTTRRGV